MPFKILFRGLFCLCLLPVLSGCGREGETPSTKVDVVLKGDTGECLGSVDESIRKYLHAEMNDGELEAMWTCLDGALTDFVTITSPEHPTGYPPDALARFFESFFVKREVPLEVAEALMNLKRIFVGGQKTFLTPAEVTKLRQFISLCRLWSQELQPHMKVLVLKNPVSVTSSDSEAALEALRDVALEVGLWMDAQGQTYTQEDLKSLLLAMSRWLQPGVTVKWMNELQEALPSLFEIKRIFVGGSADHIHSGDWPVLLKKVVSGIGVLEIVGWKMEQNQISSLASDESLPRMLLYLSQVFEGVNVPFGEVDRVMRQMSRLSWWPSALPVDGLSKGLKFVLQKFLLLEDASTPFVMDHRVVNALMHLRGEFLDALKKNGSSEFERFANPMRGVSSSSQGLIFHLYNKNAEDLRGVARNQTAVLYLLIHQLKKSFHLSEIEKPQFQQVFNEVLGVLQGLNILTDIEPSYALRLFREMDVFTWVSNGDQRLSDSEIGMYGWMALSGWVQQEWVHRDLNPVCKGDEVCIRKNWRSQSEKFLINFPQVQREMVGWSEAQKNLFFDRVNLASGSESILMNAVLMSYLEFFMMRFDSDKNSLIDVEESLTSFEVFHLTLDELLGSVGVPQSDTLAFFTFLFRYGYTPLDGGKMGAWLRYLNWKLYPRKWSFQADRMRLLQILSELSKL
ncbi:MAG TPA: hypothetical protein DCL41_09360 [Bdellovibrionales bacterium]|nr:hypothetical protein [Pseudobdellovibrionaceae bacterium]HAG92068.1 hypothetical protein [Bdellovibrionales bacterium]|tara:strand:- start:1322 stop:3367 length:2046 start_codon:yes stop_codon:yes gene_type:complete